MTTFVNAAVSPSPVRTDKRVVFGIVVVALLFRGAVCFHDLNTYSADPDAYAAIAETLARTGVFGVTTTGGHTFPTAFRPPLYPFVLSWFLANGKLASAAVAALHTLFGTVTVLCTFLASRSLLPESGRFRADIVAAGLVVVDPILLQQSTLVMTETLATMIASLVLWWWACHRESFSPVGSAVVLGVLLAIAYLCRPTFLVWAALLCVCLAVAKTSHSADWRWRLAHSAIAAGILSLAVGPWMARNVRAVGHPVWATTHGGYTLLLGNNPLFYDYLRDGEPATVWDADRFFVAYSHRYDADPTTESFWKRDWDAPGVITANATEHDDDQLAYEAARATIAREPGTFLWSCVVRVYRLWSPLPHHTEDRSWIAVVAIGLYYGCLYVAILAGLWKLGREFLRPSWWVIPTLVLTLTLVHAVYWSNIRMRAPVIPSLAIVAAAAFRRPHKQDL